MNELEVLNFYNPWWLTHQVPAVLLRKFRRELFIHLEGELPYDGHSRIISLVGPRQTGKTTILYQLVDSLLQKQVDSERILFFSLSDPVFVNNQDFLESCLTTYERIVLKEPLKTLAEPIYVFLDEVQYLGNWELWLKRYYDLGYRIKFVISGSASSRMLEKGRESLAGRISEKNLYPMNFREFLGFRQERLGENGKAPSYQINRGPFFLDIWRMYWDFKKLKSYKAFGKNLLSRENEIVARQGLASVLLNEFRERGGFPGVYQYEKEEAYRYLNQDVLERVTAQDIPQIAQVRDVRLLQTLILTVAQKTGSIFSYRNLAQESGARSETIRSYLTYLKSAFLVRELWQFRKAETARLKANKKFYICDLGLKHAILKYSPEKIFSPSETGPEIETLVFNHLQTEWERLSFWRRQDNEVDFIIDHFGFIIPVEVRYRQDIKPADLLGIYKFIKHYRAGGGLVITESLLDFREGIVFIPLWLFLLIC